MNRSFDRKIIGGFAVALGLLVAIEALLYRSTVKQAATGRAVMHTHDVLIGIQELVLRLTCWLSPASAGPNRRKSR